MDATKRPGDDDKRAAGKDETKGREAKGGATGEKPGAERSTAEIFERIDAKFGRALRELAK